MFLKSWEVADEEILRTKTLLISRIHVDVHRDDSADVSTSVVELIPEEFVPDDSLDEPLAAKGKLAKEQQQVWNRGRSELLGSDHKQTRATIPAELEPGYYVSYSGKKRIEVLHRLGQCFMLPGVDYMTNEYWSTVFADALLYETACKWCAKKSDVAPDGNSSASNTSSSEDEK